jgi:hypothetical protein
MSDYYCVMKQAKNNCTYVLDINGKPRSLERHGARFSNKEDAIAHAVKFGGKPYVRIDRTAYPIESASSAYSGHNVH